MRDFTGALYIKNCSSGQQDHNLQLTISLLSRHVSVHFSRAANPPSWRNSGESTTMAPPKEESVLSRSSAFSSSMVRGRTTEHSSLPRHLLETYVWCHLFAQLLYAPSGWNSNRQQSQPELASFMLTASQFARFFCTTSHRLYCNFTWWGMSKKRTMITTLHDYINTYKTNVNHITLYTPIEFCF